MAIIFKQRGGLFFGPWFFSYGTWTWPFATLEIHDDDTLILKYFPLESAIRFSEVDVVEVRTGLLFRLHCLGGSGVKLHCHGKGPIRQTFVSYDLETTLAPFRQSGASVRPARPTDRLP